MLKTREHCDLMEQFEKDLSGLRSNVRIDKEPKDIWHKGRIYQDGMANELFLAYRLGYAYGKAV